MGLFRTLKFIASHPFNKKRRFRGIDDFFKWQLNSIINPYPVLYNIVNDKYIIAKKGLTGVTGNIYCGLHEYGDMAFVLHYLRPLDTFVDIGANVGSYSIIAGSTGANVISIEPIPSTFNTLQRNIALNHFDGSMQSINIGLASSPGELFFTNNLDTINHVVKEGSPNTQKVEVNTLDNLFPDNIPTLIKMDVEGFEMDILKGANRIINSKQLDAIIIELNGSGEKYGINDSDITSLLNRSGYTRKTYIPEQRQLIPFSGNSSTGNGLFVKDTQKVKARLLDSQKYKIKNTYL